MNLRGTVLSSLLLVGAAMAVAQDAAKPVAMAGAKKTWSVKADYIEACSCNLFCECYFNMHPDGEMFCEFNNAINIRQGHVGDVKLDGKKFWMSGDLGSDFSKPAKLAIITFEPGTTQAEKDAIMTLVTKLYPLPGIEKLHMDEQPITWERKGLNGYAKLGDKAEIKLEGVAGPSGGIVVVNNLKYWGADKNSGFELAKSTHWYKGFDANYKHEGKNGFFISLESSGTIE